MLSNLIHTAQHAAAQTARKAAFGAAGAAFFLVGMGFLTAAAWLMLITLTSALNTALILGGLYAGVGMIFFAVAASSQRPKQPVPPAEEKPEELISQVIAAFMTGVKAGQKARS